MDCLRTPLTRVPCSIVTELFNTLDGKVITVFGFAFKADTSDTRESPAIDICKTLVAEGARVHVHPPLTLPLFAANCFCCRSLTPRCRGSKSVRIWVTRSSGSLCLMSRTGAIVHAILLPFFAVSPCAAPQRLR